MMKRALAAAIALGVTGASSWANDANETLVAMSDAARHAVFVEVVRNAGECDVVVRSMLLGENPKNAVWSVGCQNGKSYSVSVYADPKLKPFAVTCEDVKDFGKLLGTMERRVGQPQSNSVVACWKKF